MGNLVLGNCLEVLRQFSDNHFDSVVTDPPYGLAFMNKKWDYDVPSTAIWKEVLRVLKPGGHLLSFGGTRTYHRMVVNIEDAGFEIRDQIQWLYGSGFPKSLDISKAIDKQAGTEQDYSDYEYKRQSEAAKQWEGWGTALKPANEPIVLARKPLEKGLTVAANVLKWGTGGLNIDASRIASAPRPQMIRTSTVVEAKSMSGKSTGATNNGELTDQGRFPANLILDETAAAMLDEQTGELAGPGNKKPSVGTEFFGSKFAARNIPGVNNYPGQTGGPSRFFYVAKASKSERNKGLEDAPLSIVSDGREKSIDNPFLRGETERKNTHPTVKPVKLMEYLVKLITPPNGIVLDPFMGSGTTGVACKSLGVRFVGIEREEAYVEIAKRRLEFSEAMIRASIE